jgi:hypothetical protein
MSTPHLIKADDLLTEFVAAGLFLPVALMLQEVATAILSNDERAPHFPLVLKVILLMSMLIVSVAGVLLLGFAFHVAQKGRGGIEPKHCGMACLLFLFFVIAASTREGMRWGFNGALLSSFGVVLFLDDEMTESLVENCAETVAEVFGLPFNEDFKLFIGALLIIVACTSIIFSGQ